MFKILFCFSGCVFIFCLAQAQELIVWNVGQGQWVTEVSQDSCFHSDMGGERDIVSQVARLCGAKKNYVHLSHWDWDHISFARKFFRQVPRSCLVQMPAGESSAWKKKIIAALPLCDSQSHQRSWRLVFRSESFKQSNDGSAVIWLPASRVLIPGDSTRSMEKRWRDGVPRSTQGLILGHHGSRTSTSSVLLQTMPHLQWAVASAREARYGHPHSTVRDLLKRKKIPLLRTDEWGDLHFGTGPSLISVK